MKGNVRIGVALMVGIVVILGALVVKDKSALSQEGSVIVSQAPERTYIASDDADGDGTKDWEESLEGLITDTVVVASGTSTDSEGTAPYTPPTTFTGKFSEAFFQDYLSGKIAGADMSDPTELVTKAVTAIDANTQSKRYARRNIHTVPSTPESLRAYGNELATILEKYSIQNEHELLIFERAMKTQDQSLLADLAPIRDVYAYTIADTLRLDVPDSAVSAHINFLNASEAIRTDLDAMLIAFDDPLYALARIRWYQDDAKTLYDSLTDIFTLFNSAGISFANNEPGAVFYLFEK